MHQANAITSALSDDNRQTANSGQAESRSPDEYTYAGPNFNNPQVDAFVRQSDAKRISDEYPEVHRDMPITTKYLYPTLTASESRVMNRDFESKEFEQFTGQDTANYLSSYIYTSSLESVNGDVRDVAKSQEALSTVMSPNSKDFATFANLIPTSAGGIKSISEAIGNDYPHLKPYSTFMGFNVGKFGGQVVKIRGLENGGGSVTIELYIVKASEDESIKVLMYQDYFDPNNPAVVAALEQLQRQN